MSGDVTVQAAGHPLRQAPPALEGLERVADGAPARVEVEARVTGAAAPGQDVGEARPAGEGRGARGAAGHLQQHVGGGLGQGGEAIDLHLVEGDGRRPRVAARAHPQGAAAAGLDGARLEGQARAARRAGRGRREPALGRGPLEDEGPGEEVEAQAEVLEEDVVHPQRHRWRRGGGRRHLGPAGRHRSPQRALEAELT
jgi:hypothetical protein